MGIGSGERGGRMRMVVVGATLGATITAGYDGQIGNVRLFDSSQNRQIEAMPDTNCDPSLQECVGTVTGPEQYGDFYEEERESDESEDEIVDEEEESDEEDQENGPTNEGLDPADAPRQPAMPVGNPGEYTCTMTFDGNGDIASFVASIGEGETGCLPGGEYGADNFSLDAPNARLASVPGELATITMSGGSEINGEGSGYERLSLVSGSEGNAVRINSDNAYLYNNAITNNNQGNVDAQCALVGSSDESADDVRILGNRFDGCGENDNNAHAIYSQNSDRLEVIDNIVTDVGGYSIHLYPDARNSTVKNNVIVPGEETSRGHIIVAGESSGNEVRSNVILNADVLEESGSNDISNNCTDPEFVDQQAGDFRLKDGSCAGMVEYDTAAKALDAE